MNKRIFFKTHFYKQSILLFLVSLLAACFEENKSSGLSLPPINPNLSTESPEGIWLFHTNLSIVENSYKEDRQRELNNQYFLRQLVTIKQAPNEHEYWIRGGCYHLLSEESRSSILTFDDNTKLPLTWFYSDQRMLPEDEVQDYYNLSDIRLLDEMDPNLHWHQQKSGALMFNKNRSLTGELIFDNTAIHDYDDISDANFFSVVLLNGYKKIQQFKKINIEAVKLSDDTNFKTANELKYYLTIQSNILDVNHDNYELFCLDARKVKSHTSEFNNGEISKESYNFEALTLGLDKTPDEINSEENEPYVNNDIFVTSKQSQTDGHSLYLMNSDYNTYHGTQVCHENSDDDCLENISYDIQQRINQTDLFSVTGEIIEHDGSQVSIQVKVELSP